MIWVSFEAPPACSRLSKPPGNYPSIAGLVTLPRVERREVNDETFTLESTCSLPKSSFLPHVEVVEQWNYVVSVLISGLWDYSSN